MTKFFCHFQTICLSSKLMYYVLCILGGRQGSKLLRRNCFYRPSHPQLGKLKTVKGDLLTHSEGGLFLHYDHTGNGIRMEMMALLKGPF